MVRPAWFNDALREMKESGRPGLLVVVRESGFLKGLSDTLQGLLGRKTFDNLRRSAVIGFLPESSAKACVPGLPDGHGLARMDADGTLTASMKLDLAGEDLLPALRKLLRTEDVARPGALKELPYGVEWAEEQHHRLFGTRYDPCAGCGMPRMSNNASQLIRYLRVLDK